MGKSSYVIGLYLLGLNNSSNLNLVFDYDTTGKSAALKVTAGHRSMTADISALTP